MNIHRGLLHHLIIRVSDVARSAQFYGPVFRYLGYDLAGQSDRYQDWKRWEFDTPHEISIVQGDPFFPFLPLTSVQSHRRIIFQQLNFMNFSGKFSFLLLGMFLLSISVTQASVPDQKIASWTARYRDTPFMSDTTRQYVESYTLSVSDGVLVITCRDMTDNSTSVEKVPLSRIKDVKGSDEGNCLQITVYATGNYVSSSDGDGAMDATNFAFSSNDTTTYKAVLAKLNSIIGG
jgi:hypothetical protein